MSGSILSPSTENLTANNSDVNFDGQKNKNSTAEQNIENVDYTREQRKLQICNKNIVLNFY